jgi:tetratricopeptide (TPR) repeat protein
MRKIFFSVLMLMLFITIISNVYAQTPQETLAQHISDLLKNPNDYALREKIIKHVQTMSPAPAVPEEAERFMARGTAATKNAKDANDFKDAVKEFEKAALSAPWLASAYYNLGIARDKAGMYADAITSLKLYLLASPNATDAKSVKNFIYEIEYKQEKAAKDKIETERRQQALKAEEDVRALQQKVDEFYRRCDGKRYVWHWDEPIDSQSVDETADLRGRRIILGSVYKAGRVIPSNMQRGVWREMWDLRISRMEMERGRLVLYFDNSNNNWMYEKGYLNEDCEIKFKFNHGNESGYYIPVNS